MPVGDGPHRRHLLAGEEMYHTLILNHDAIMARGI